MSASREEGAAEQDGHGASRHRGTGEKGAAKVVPLSEWIVATLGVVLVLSTLGYLAYSAVASDRDSPRISVQVDSILNVDGTSLAMITVRNSGSRAAMGVQIEGERGDGSEVMRSTITFDYLPPFSDRSGILSFGTAAGAGAGTVPRVRVTAFRE